jgi:hypothetical protein
VDTGDGNDTVRVGSTTGSVGQLEGIPDPFSTSALNDSAGNAFIKSRLSLTGGLGAGDELKVYDGFDKSSENGILTRNEILGFGMTLGIG